MPVNPPILKLEDFSGSALPLCYRNLYLRRIPPFAAKRKLLTYNQKYKFFGAEVLSSSKPVTKIVA